MKTLQWVFLFVLIQGIHPINSDEKKLKSENILSDQSSTALPASDIWTLSKKVIPAAFSRSADANNYVKIDVQENSAVVHLSYNSGKWEIEYTWTAPPKTIDNNGTDIQLSQRLISGDPERWNALNIKLIIARFYQQSQLNLLPPVYGEQETAATFTGQEKSARFFFSPMVIKTGNKGEKICTELSVRLFVPFLSQGTDLYWYYLYSCDGKPSIEKKVDLVLKPEYFTIEETRFGTQTYNLPSITSSDKQLLRCMITNNSKVDTAKNVLVQFYCKPEGAKEFYPVNDPVEVADLKPKNYNYAFTTWDLKGKNVENAVLKVVAYIPGQEDTNPADNEAEIKCNVYYAFNGSRAFDPIGDTYSFKNYGFNGREGEEMLEDILATYVNVLATGDAPKNFWKRLLYPQTYLRLQNYFSQSLEKSGGHCFGITATSMAYFENPSLRPLGKTVLSLTQAEASTNIAIYHRAQLAEFYQAVMTGENTQEFSMSVPNFYRDAKTILKGTRQCVNVGFYGEIVTRDLNGTVNRKNWGHSVLGYKLIEVEGRPPAVYIYDSNAPFNLLAGCDQRRQIVLWLDTQRWRHMPLSQLYDTGISSMIGIVKNFRRDMHLEEVNALVPKLKASALETIGFLKNMNKVMTVLRCPADALFIDAAGRKTGVINGKNVNEIPGATVLTEGDVEIYLLPKGQKYNISVKGLEQGTAGFDLIRADSEKQAALTVFDNLPVNKGSAFQGVIDEMGNMTEFIVPSGRISPQTGTVLVEGEPKMPINNLAGNQNQRKADEPKTEENLAMVKQISVSGTAAILNQSNIPVQTFKSNDGSSYLKTQLNKLNIGVFFADPVGADFSRIHLFCAFRTKLTQEQLKSFNSQNPGSEAYIDKDGDAVLTTQLSVSDGVSKNKILEFIKNFGELAVKFGELKGK